MIPWKRFIRFPTMIDWLPNDATILMYLREYFKHPFNEKSTPYNIQNWNFYGLDKKIKDTFKNNATKTR